MVKEETPAFVINPSDNDESLYSHVYWNSWPPLPRCEAYESQVSSMQEQVGHLETTVASMREERDKAQTALKRLMDEVKAKEEQWASESQVSHTLFTLTLLCYCSSQVYSLSALFPHLLFLFSGVVICLYSSYMCHLSSCVTYLSSSFLSLAYSLSSFSFSTSFTHMISLHRCVIYLSSSLPFTLHQLALQTWCQSCKPLTSAY